jgi:hypothetical protein
MTKMGSCFLALAEDCSVVKVSFFCNWWTIRVLNIWLSPVIGYSFSAFYGWFVTYRMSSNIRYKTIFNISGLKRNMPFQHFESWSRYLILHICHFWPFYPFCCSHIWPRNGPTAVAPGLYARCRREGEHCAKDAGFVLRRRPGRSVKWVMLLQHIYIVL